MSEQPSFKNTAQPDLGQNDFDEFCQQWGQAPKIDEKNQNFFKIFGNSLFLSQYAIQNPKVFENYIQSSYKVQEKPLDVFIKEINQACQNQDILTTLKKYKYQEYLRLTVKELMGQNQPVIYRELAHLADATIQKITLHLSQNLLNRYNLQSSMLCDFGLLGMGKLGGLELNYSSDIDMIGFYDKDIDWGPITSHEFFEKLFAKVGTTLSGVDQNGFLFRTDWDLRPEGSSGALSNSFHAMEVYYETFGEEWERQAYIKARSVYESRDIGQQFLKFIQPFVYRKTFDEKTVKNVWDMKAKIITALKQKPSQGLNIKLDHGGIRDIEFFAQGFQLLHGGLRPELRQTNTIQTLQTLGHLGIVPQAKTQQLEKCYLFLRRLESCLQMENEQQTHVYKDDFDFKLKQARRMGIWLEPKESVNLLDEQLLKVRDGVRRIFEEYYQG